jgi:transglutaminase-like putative cysteine protease
MSMDELTRQSFLRSTSVIDWGNAAVSAQAADLRRDDPVRTARACFEFVRGCIKHSRDYELDPCTWRASDVLRHRTGYCYAKSHLLAALLRANGLPAAFCYQRLSVNDYGPPYSLHGFNAVELPGIGWYRMDARGNKPGVNAQFTPPVECLAFKLQSPDEFEFENL